jgi:hypothetical protein
MPLAPIFSSYFFDRFDKCENIRYTGRVRGNGADIRRTLLSTPANTTPFALGALRLRDVRLGHLDLILVLDVLNVLVGLCRPTQIVDRVSNHVDFGSPFPGHVVSSG